MLHRNSQKRYYFTGAIYFITVTTQDQLPYFKEKIFCNELIKDLQFCKKLKKFKLYAFVILPDHIHLLIQPGDEYNISQILHNLKRTSSFHINQMTKCYEGEDIYPHLQESVTCLKFQWQKSFHDHIIRNEKDFQNHYRYTVYNFKKHNLPDDWQYTSLNYNNLIDKYN